MKLHQLGEMCRRYGVDIMYAHGSRCKEIVRFVAGEGTVEKGNLSDADIGVRMSKDVRLSVKDKVRLAIDLEDLFEVGRVDLVVLSEVDPFLAANVIRGERLYCKDEFSADEYELYILRRAGDLAPLERERLRLILGEEK